nr:MAG TPA: hypothetical protein [Caudoviricetes sp.]
MKLKEINLCLNGETETYVDVPEEMVNKVCIQHMNILLRHTLNEAIKNYKSVIYNRISFSKAENKNIIHETNVDLVTSTNVKYKISIHAKENEIELIIIIKNDLNKKDEQEQLKIIEINKEKDKEGIEALKFILYAIFELYQLSAKTLLEEVNFNYEE